MNQYINIGRENSSVMKQMSPMGNIGNQSINRINTNASTNYEANNFTRKRKSASGGGAKIDISDGNISYKAFSDANNSHIIQS